MAATNLQGPTDVELQNTLKILDFDSYSDEDLANLSKELEKRVDLIALETDTFASYYARVNPNQKEEESAVETREDDRKDPKKKKKGEKAREVEQLLVLSNEQKTDIATRELEELRDKIEQDKEDWIKNVDNAKAELEEFEIRHAEVKKACYEFKRDIEDQSATKNGKVTAERLVRYFEEKIRAKDTLIEKTRLKNAALKTHMVKLHTQLKQKEEMGEVLHAIDFDQLQIENKQYLLKIEERNTELLKLKVTAGNTTLTLNSHKQRLMKLSNECARLSQEIQSRRDLLQRLSVEKELVEKDRAKALKNNQWLNEQISQFSVPEVMDYVLVKASQHELEKKVKGLTRKVEITSLQSKRMKSLWSKIATENKERRKSKIPVELPPIS